MTKIWAHRGACADAPENTLPAFRLAFDQGADGVELDGERRHGRSGGLPRCSHLHQTSELLGRDLRVDFRPASPFFILAMDATGMPESRSLMLAKVLDLVRGTDKVVDIELKNSVVRYPGMEEQVDALVAGFGLADQVWYSSFSGDPQPAAPGGTRIAGRAWRALRRAVGPESCDFWGGRPASTGHYGRCRPG